MKKIVPILIVLLLCATRSWSQGQTQKPVTIRVVTTDLGSKVKADIVAYNFSKIVGFQLNILWDDMVVKNPVYSSLLSNFSMVNQGTFPGESRITWTTSNTLPTGINSTTIVSITFDKINNDDPAFQIVNTPSLAIEFTSENLAIIPYIILSNSANASSLKGRVFVDTDNNCQINAGDGPSKNRLVKASNPTEGDFYGMGDANGNYGIYLLNNDVPYTLSVETDTTLWKPCTQNVLVTKPSQSSGQSIDFSIQVKKNCILNEVKVSNNFLRRCFSNGYGVAYKNTGTLPSLNTYIVLTLDKDLILENMTVPYTSLGGQQYKIEIGTLDIEEQGSFGFTAKLSCNSTILGQTHCVKAEIFPKASCEEDLGKSAMIKTNCENGKIGFEVENQGIASLTNANYIVVEDDMIFKQAAVPTLNPLQKFSLETPANGATWRLEIRKNNVLLNAKFVEGCGTNSQGKFSTGYAMQFPQPEPSISEDTDCKQSIGSYDPNDKQGFPSGSGAKHYIEQNTPIEYLIRFQNTGTDTAFTVVVEDVIDDKLLDISSLRILNTSHKVELSIKNRNTLVFAYKNIMLIDSFKNEKLSHGFVKFLIAQKPNVAMGSVIKNKAAIFFDFNAPIITNETFHTVGRDFLMVKSQEVFLPNVEVLVRPNPFNDQAILSVQGMENELLRLDIFDLLGRKIFTQESDNQSFDLSRNQLSNGLLLYRIYNGTQVVASGKMVAE